MGLQENKVKSLQLLSISQILHPPSCLVCDHSVSTGHFLCEWQRVIRPDWWISLFLLEIESILRVKEITMNNSQQNTSIITGTWSQQGDWLLKICLWILFLVQEGKTTTRGCLHCREDSSRAELAPTYDFWDWIDFQKNQVLLHSPYSLWSHCINVLGKAEVIVSQVFLNHVPQGSIHRGTSSILQMFGLNFFNMVSFF